MGNGFPTPEVEVGRIVFRSWEHEWQTGDKETFSLASAKKLLPSEITRPIYEVLERWERDLLRSSLPYPPYGLRIRRAKSEWLDLMLSAYKGEPLFYGVENATKYGLEGRSIGELCPNWDAALPEPRSKQGRFGTTLHAPLAGSNLTWAYELEWRPAVFPEQEVNIDDLLRHFSPRYREPTIFG
ncbi:MAG TPA: hypothetical protein VGG99_20965 [Acetobacteraceae bacterium]|jgi:hypothetical protein